MAVPRNRLSNARKNIRRSHHAKKPVQVVLCGKCRQKKLPHILCTNCGSYKFRTVLEVDA